MTNTVERESRPMARAAVTENQQGNRSDSNYTPWEYQSTGADTQVPRTNYAVHVVSTRRDGVQVGQTFATLAAAERKVLRQRERGLPVQVSLVRLVPVPWTVLGGGRNV